MGVIQFAYDIFNCAQFCAHRQTRPPDTYLDVSPRNAMKHRRLSRFVEIRRVWAKLLILRTGRIRRQIQPAPGRESSYVLSSTRQGECSISTLESKIADLQL
jgi:hypothetical protein